MTFSNQISVDQKRDLEGEVTNDEIKKAVWDCGTDKAPGDIVSEVQSAFIAGRQILDGLFILNEVLQWCKIKKKQALIFKVDFEKAYDSLRWDFLDEVLKKFGFGEKWCKWIQACLKSSLGSVIINGSSTEEFQFSKGLKQRDPLSLFLFLLIMESLHLSFQRVVDAGLFQGLQVGGSVNLSHMFFADDAVLLDSGAKEDTWNDGGKFKCRFLRMYALESCKSIAVGRKLAQSSLIDSFRRSPRGGAEQQQYNDLEDM
nr:RNA-directed DNA polymerase, eukaryota [Tanacetum cinerariifolium]